MIPLLFLHMSRLTHFVHVYYIRAFYNNLYPHTYLVGLAAMHFSLSFMTDFYALTFCKAAIGLIRY